MVTLVVLAPEGELVVVEDLGVTVFGVGRVGFLGEFGTGGRVGLFLAG